VSSPAVAAGDEIARLLGAGDEHRRAGDAAAALQAYLAAADLSELPSGAACVRVARAHADANDLDEARRWLLRTVDAGDDFASWDAAAQLLARIGAPTDGVKRTARVAVLGSYTTTYLARLLRLVGARRGIAIEVYESGYGQFRQDLLDPSSALHGFAPDVVVLAVDARATTLPDVGSDPDADVDAEVAQWRALWSRVEGLGATLVQHNFVVPTESALAHLDAELPGSRYRLLQRVNARLADELPSTANVVDCERLAAAFGKDRWTDPLWWDRAKLSVSLPATPLLATHTAAVIAGRLGLGRKCLVLDLDNTVWGGVIGEDGLGGLKLGGDAAGDAFLAFQDRVLALQRRGVVLAACSKNDDHVAREPFERHPEMRLQLGDFAAFVANWQSKVDNIKQIALDLSLGLDALVYVDDNPVERQEVRRFLPDVDTVVIPPQPSLYARSLAEYPWFETGAFTAEDAQRTEQYRARAEIKALERTAESIDDFYRDLHMAAVVRPFDAADLPRVAQLIGKTNQFNLTSRRHDLAALQVMQADPACVHLSIRLRDRFADHGLVGVVIGRVEDDVLDVDTWLMSCRVIGRTAERAMLGALARAGEQHGCATLRGTYIPTAKNGLVRELYPSLGFELEQDDEGTTTWRRAIDSDALAGSAFIDVIAEVDRGAA
jgi:FkbH-like protein